MQVWNVLHVARWKYRTQKWRKNSPSGHHPTTLSGYIFATEAFIDNRKKLVKQQYLLHMSAQYGELRPTSGWDRFGSLGHPSYFQRLPCLGSVTARQSSSERQPNFVALNRGRHLCSAERPSRWATHFSSLVRCSLLSVYKNVLSNVLLRCLSSVTYAGDCNNQGIFAVWKWLPCGCVIMLEHLSWLLVILVLISCWLSTSRYLLTLLRLYILSLMLAVLMVSVCLLSCYFCESVMGNLW